MRVEASSALLRADLAVLSAAGVRRSPCLRRQTRSRLSVHPVASGLGGLHHLEHPRSHRPFFSVQTDPEGKVPGLGDVLLLEISDRGGSDSSNVRKPFSGRDVRFNNLFFIFVMIKFQSLTKYTSHKQN